MGKKDISPLSGVYLVRLGSKEGHETVDPATMSIMLLLAKLVQPLLNKWRDTALLSTYRCVDALVHD
ncbi:hypothetical protein [Nitrosospira briensis]|uniref:hypothetical protein n=1 Tax=Nitrosospira briensis TaxID=35799 RepID=UPI0008E61D0C|nr:hypothetical protein [Nitrosospira briensis]SFO42375.1 hypothetical protein SAMN05216332_1165 [Nitrosospira briensis]